MGLITGFIEGLITFDSEGSLRALPFQDKIEDATLSYTTENLFSETFGADGRKGMSEACPFRHELSVTLSSTNLAWSFLQAATNTLARDAEVPKRWAYSHVIKEAEITGGDATLEVDWTPVVGTDVLVSDIEGNQYDVTFSTGTPNTLVIEGVTAGQSVNISYVRPASGTNNEIALGSGEMLPEIGFYGRFFGCPDTLLVQVNRAIIQSELSMQVNTSPASAALTLMALRDAEGNFATIEKL